MHKLLLLHILAIILYFPVVLVLFLYLAARPTKMATFLFGLQAILDVFDKDDSRTPKS